MTATAGSATSRRRRIARVCLAVGVPLLGGALVGLSLPPLAPWPVGVVGAALVVAALRDHTWKGRLGVGLLAGLGQFSVGLAWAVQFNVAGYVALVVVESLILGVGAMLMPPRGVLRVPAAAAALTLAEWARQSWPFGGLPLGSAALGQIGGPLQFAARLGGPLLVVFVLVLAGGSLGELAVAARTLLPARRSPGGRRPLGGPHPLGDRRPPGARRPPGDRRSFSARSFGARVVGACSLVVAAAIAGGGALAAPAIPTVASDQLRVAIVQGGGVRGLTELQVPASDVLRAALRETTHVTGHPQLILWPEDVVSLGATQFAGSAVERRLSAIARRHRATFIVGVTQDVGATRFRNEVVAFSPAGRVVARFEKVHRVPFGEYVPLRSFFSHLANLRDVSRDAIPGSGSGMVGTPAGRFGVLISYEVFFAGRGRSGVRAGGQVVLVPTNTSSYSSDQAPAQEIAASRLQAIEQGRYVLQAAPTGYSAVITPSGVVTARSRLSVPTVIEATVVRIDGTTPYTDLGDLPVLIGSAVLLVLGWVLARRSTERPGARSGAGSGAGSSSAPGSVGDPANHSVEG